MEQHNRCNVQSPFHMSDDSCSPQHFQECKSLEELRLSRNKANHKRSFGPTCGTSQQNPMVAGSSFEQPTKTNHYCTQSSAIGHTNQHPCQQHACMRATDECCAQTNVQSHACQHALNLNCGNANMCVHARPSSCGAPVHLVLCPSNTYKIKASGTSGCGTKAHTRAPTNPKDFKNNFSNKTPNKQQDIKIYELCSVHNAFDNTCKSFHLARKMLKDISEMNFDLKHRINIKHMNVIFKIIKTVLVVPKEEFNSAVDSLNSYYGDSFLVKIKVKNLYLLLNVRNTIESAEVILNDLFILYTSTYIRDTPTGSMVLSALANVIKAYESGITNLNGFRNINGELFSKPQHCDRKYNFDIKFGNTNANAFNDNSSCNTSDTAFGNSPHSNTGLKFGSNLLNNTIPEDEVSPGFGKSAFSSNTVLTFGSTTLNNTAQKAEVGSGFGSAFGCPTGLTFGLGTLNNTTSRTKITRGLGRAGRNSNTGLAFGSCNLNNATEKSEVDRGFGKAGFNDNAVLTFGSRNSDNTTPKDEVVSGFRIGFGCSPGLKFGANTSKKTTSKTSVSSRFGNAGFSYSKGQSYGSRTSNDDPNSSVGSGFDNGFASGSNNPNFDPRSDKAPNSFVFEKPDNACDPNTSSFVSGAGNANSSLCTEVSNPGSLRFCFNKPNETVSGTDNNGRGSNIELEVVSNNSNTTITKLDKNVPGSNDIVIVNNPSNTNSDGSECKNNDLQTEATNSNLF